LEVGEPQNCWLLLIKKVSTLFIQLQSVQYSADGLKLSNDTTVNSNFNQINIEAEPKNGKLQSFDSRAGGDSIEFIDLCSY
jgi:hypothetical protein